MLRSPSPLTSHWLGGLPRRQFSATIAFAGVSHGAASAVRAHGAIEGELRTHHIPWTVRDFCIDSSSYASARALPRRRGGERGLVGGRSVTSRTWEKAHMSGKSDCRGVTREIPG